VEGRAGDPEGGSRGGRVGASGEERVGYDAREGVGDQGWLWSLLRQTLLVALAVLQDGEHVVLSQGVAGAEVGGGCAAWSFWHVGLCLLMRLAVCWAGVIYETVFGPWGWLLR
jgi:hypothetical protein